MLAVNITVVCSITVTTRDRITSTTGDSVEFPCHTDAVHATVYWKRGPSFENSTLVVNVFKGAAYPRRPNVRMDVSNYSMWLDDVKLLDAGSYLCVIAPLPRFGMPKMSGTWLDIIDVIEVEDVYAGYQTTTLMMQDSSTELILNISDTTAVASTVAAVQTNTPAINHRTPLASMVTHTTEPSTSPSSGTDDQTEPDWDATTTPSSTGSTGSYSTHPAPPDDGKDEAIIMSNLESPVQGLLVAFSNGSDQGSFINYINLLLSTVFAIWERHSGTD